MHVLLKNIANKIELLEPNFIKKFTPIDNEQLEDVDLIDVSEEQISDLAGMTFAIKYVNAKAITSNRRITFLKFSHKNDGDLLIYARCHESQKNKNFLYSRIKEIIDWDTGEVFEDTDKFLEDILDIESTKLPSYNYKPLVQCRAPLTFLTAIAYSDGKLYDVEVDAILRFCDHHCIENDIRLSSDDFDRFTTFIKRFNPVKFHALECLKYFDQNPSDFDATLRHSHRVANSDGILSPEEVELIMKLECESV